LSNKAAHNVLLNLRAICNPSNMYLFLNIYANIIEPIN
jgi:hypothetical protein